jgi:hypothetical protein
MGDSSLWRELMSKTSMTRIFSRECKLSAVRRMLADENVSALARELAVLRKDGFRPKISTMTVVQGGVMVRGVFILEFGRFALDRRARRGQGRSLNRLAARPVGAQAATDTDFAATIVMMDLVSVVLPTPGPPVITMILLASATATARR